MTSRAGRAGPASSRCWHYRTARDRLDGGGRPLPFKPEETPTMLSFELTRQMPQREPLWEDPAAFHAPRQSQESGFSRRSAPAPGQPFAPSAPLPSHSLRWLVTMATVTTDGRAGTQTFVVDAPTSREALAEARARLRTPVAVARRRGAAIDPASAVAEDWRSWGRAQARGWEGTG